MEETQIFEPEKVEEKVRYFEYVCTKCNAKDVLKNFPDELIPPAANCWNCRAGREFQSTSDQIANGVGMFKKREVNVDEYQSNFEKTRNKVTYISDLKKEEENV